MITNSSNNEIIKLKSREPFCANSSDISVSILEGSVDVYITEITDEFSNDRVYLTTAISGDIVPSLPKLNNKNYKIILVANFDDKMNACVIEILDRNSKIEKINFLKKCKLVFPTSNFSDKHFSEIIVDQYTDSQIRSRQRYYFEKKSNEAATNSTKLATARALKSNEVFPSVPESSELYSVASMLCDSLNISHLDFDELPKLESNDFNLEKFASLSSFLCRKIKLENNWINKDIGPFLTFYGDEEQPVVVMPKFTTHYVAYFADGSKKRITKHNFKDFSYKAYIFSKPLKNKSLSGRDLFSFAINYIKPHEIISFILLSIVVGGVCVVQPYFNQYVFGKLYANTNNLSIVFLGFLIIALLLCSFQVAVTKFLVQNSFISRLKYNLQAAIVDRIFKLHIDYFESDDAAILGLRASNLPGFIESFLSSILTIFMSLLYSIVLFVIMVSFSAYLSIVGLAAVVLAFIILLLISIRQFVYITESLDIESVKSSLLYQVILSISKIKVAGVESRFIGKYFKEHIKSSIVNSKSLINFNKFQVFTAIFTALSSLIIYGCTISANPVLEFNMLIGFLSAYGLFISYVFSISGSINSLVCSMPIFKRALPIIKNKPEDTSSGKIVSSLSGRIKVANLSFAYDSIRKQVLNDICFNVEPGEFVGIAGKSGCGKSTLLNILLGLYKPSSGEIYYDDVSISSYNMRSLRSNFGAVLQDDHIISGTIYDNITFTNPDLSYDEVNALAKKCGLEEDITNMPSGLNTLISDEAQTISGGQKQKIIIARALANNPSIIFFDEATSSLDLVNQFIVTDTLSNLKVTRIAVAHRVSTLKDCDRIIVIDNGSIAQIGTFSELSKQEGLFQELVKRQQLS